LYDGKKSGVYVSAGSREVRDMPSPSSRHCSPEEAALLDALASRYPEAHRNSIHEQLVDVLRLAQAHHLSYDTTVRLAEARLLAGL
jgi:hypothetical protein